MTDTRLISEVRSCRHRLARRSADHFRCETSQSASHPLTFHGAARRNVERMGLVTRYPEAHFAGVGQLMFGAHPGAAHSGRNDVNAIRKSTSNAENSVS